MSVLSFEKEALITDAFKADFLELGKIIELDNTVRKEKLFMVINRGFYH